MCVGVVENDLMVRVGPQGYKDLIREPHARTMNVTGRRMKGFLFVASDGSEGDTDLERWVALPLRVRTPNP
jgi:hypothetical protein